MFRRSWIAWYKTRRILRVPAGDFDDGAADGALVTEDSDDIVTEAGDFITTEEA